MKSLNKLIYTAIIAIFLTGAFSCNKEELKPVLSFVSEPGYQANDTILSVGDTIKVLLDITWNGKHRITEIVLNMNDQLAGKYPIDVDQGQFSFNIVKGLSEVEVWDFTVSDEGGNMQTITLTLTKDPNSLYSGLKYYDSIFLGAQANNSKPGFLSLSGSTYYRLDGAFMNQDKVDIIFYWDENDQASLASPAADFPSGVFAQSQEPSVWDTRNTTLFQQVEMVKEIFYGMINDAYIIENFDESLATKKVTELQKEQFYLFKLEGGKMGLIYIIDVLASSDGEINFALKVQED